MSQVKLDGKDFTVKGLSLNVAISFEKKGPFFSNGHIFDLSGWIYLIFVLLERSTSVLFKNGVFL